MLVLLIQTPPHQGVLSRQGGGAALKVACRANQYAATMLLYGDPAGGSQVHNPIKPRLEITRKAAHSHSLHPAILQGLVRLFDTPLINIPTQM
jgi:hypothetical protein